MSGAIEQPVRVSIPGKVMLSGEYAVLYGGVAVLMPVPCYLEVEEVFEKPAQSITPVIKTSLEIPVPETGDYEKTHGLPLLKIDSTAFNKESPEGKILKLGLGSSAAEAVGVIATRYQRAGLDWKKHRKEIAHLAVEAHNIAQGGKGSGADVFTSALDQPVVFSKTGDIYNARTFSISEDYLNGSSLKLNLAWTGIPANTRDMVELFEKWVKSFGEEGNILLEELIEQSWVVSKSWTEKTENYIPKEMKEYAEIMKRCADAAGIPYWTKTHEKIADWAESNGGYAKPTGAGGGDMVLLIGDLPIQELDYDTIPLQGDIL